MNPEKLYRPNVAAIVVSAKYPNVCEVFIAERSDIEGAWQFPQGGIDEGETPKEALYRELKEEIGTDDIEVIAEFPKWITYDFPAAISPSMKPYSGQKQRYFLVRLAHNAKIDLATHVPEFSQYEYVNLATLFKKVAHFKRPVYKEVIKYFQQEGYL